MISIAICDDTERERKEVYEEVIKYFKEKDDIAEIRLFDNGNSLWYEIEDRKNFDIFLLDIEMPEIGGIDLTYEIKQRMPHALVIFVTSYEKYVYESFKVQPYRFIPKSRMSDMLPNALADAINYISKQTDQVYVVKNQQRMEKVLIKDIIYIWHHGKYTYIKKINGQDIKIRKTLGEIYRELPGDRFQWVSRGCICNLYHIVKISKNNVYLSNGEKQSFGREYLRETLERLQHYVMEEENI
ncbi:MAG: response regulator transcription factor [Lachnospiraceae bacterium]|nr:response regulator transcription factor [Lachnospiraceae bacterium]